MLLRIIFVVLALCGTAVARQPAGQPPPANPSAPPAPAAAPTPAPSSPEDDARPEKVLGVGDAAPELTISKWLRGEPVAKFETGRVYVVEFWATWCAPCRRSIETLSKLQAKHDAAKLTVIGVCGTDSHGETPERIEAFLKARADRVQQRIAMDDESATRADWLGAARILQIPAAFVVAPDGRLAWIGNPATSPSSLQRTVEELLAGTFNFDKALAAARVETARRAEAEAKGIELQVKLRHALQENDYESVAIVIDAMIRLDPERYARLSVTRFETLLLGQQKVDAALDYARELMIDRLREDPMGLQALAWSVLENVKTTRGRDLALDIATRANDLMESEDAVVLDTLARAQFEKGDVEGATASQRKAVEKAPPGKVAEQMTQTLAKYVSARKR